MPKATPCLDLVQVYGVIDSAPYSRHSLTAPYSSKPATLRFSNTDPSGLTIPQRQSIPQSSLVSSHIRYTYNIIPLVSPASLSTTGYLYPLSSLPSQPLRRQLGGPRPLLPRHPQTPCHSLRPSPIDEVTKKPHLRQACLFACSNLRLQRRLYGLHTVIQNTAAANRKSCSRPPEIHSLTVHTST